jgi:predicted RNA-binding protein with PIN domain
VSLHYLIDGYNLLYALSEVPSGTWREKREKLLAWLRAKRPQGKNRATIVFDSRTGWGERTTEGELDVLFTAGETADERIGQLVRDAKNPRALVVVSNDRGVRALVRGTGAKWITVSEFLAPLRQRRARASISEWRIPQGSEDITEEFKKRWL